MSTCKPDEYLTVIEVDHGDQPVFAFDVENNPVAVENAYGRVVVFQFIR
jgi:hypothetical protein